MPYICFSKTIQPMSVLDDIRKPVLEDIDAYGTFLKRNVISDRPFVSDILDYIFENRGKGIRPLLVMLSAGMHSSCGLGPRTHTACLLVDMLHTASLIHDDVIDHSDMRHGKPSVNSRWGNHNAVLAGDYIIAKALDTGLHSGQFDIVTYVTHSLGLLCEGELVQGDHVARLDMTRDVYFDVIYRKTASLIAASGGVGALSVGAPRDKVQGMNLFGKYVGLAFQIKDDILDYDLDADTGKPSCIDLRERKITLPLLHVLENSSESRRNELLEKLAAIDSHPENELYIHDVVVEEGGIEAAEDAMHGFLSRAASILSQYPQSPYRDSLVLLCGYVADREK